MSKEKAIYINSQGGEGFNLALAHVIPEFKEKYETIAVLSPYSDIFECKPEVDLVYRPNELRDFIFDAKAKNARLICERMYDSQEFIYKELSYADAWRKAAGIPVKGNKNGSDTVANFDTSKYNLANQAASALKQIKDNGFDDFVIMQFSGGQSPLVNVPIGERTKEDGTKEQFPDWGKVPYNYENEPLKRHYPIDLAKKFVELFQAAHPKTAVVLYQLPNEPYSFNNTFKFVLPYLTYYELAKLPECTGTVSIDSSLQHLIAGVTKSVVIWGHSLPLSFGYEYNKNVIQDCRRDDILYFSALGPSGAAIKYIKPEKLLEETDSYLFGKETK
ncbi:MAG: hypothetical protein J6S67_02720 [Methanobrevibacter sp.]|nr:hypothetical protein [Methanobrevibacter sp.]